jgi:hypothetical protein
MTSAAWPALDVLQFRIAGLGIEIAWDGATIQYDSANAFYDKFRATGPAEVRLQVHCGKLPRLHRGRLIFDALPNHWRLFRLDGRYLFEIFDSHPPHPLAQLALVSSDFHTGEVYLQPQRDANRWSWSLPRLMNPFGELLLINILSQGRGVLLHALGVSDRGEGSLFIGGSGAGKTTLANLYKPHQGVTILSDERVVVTKEDGRFWFSGTPWPGAGLMVSADSVPLCKVFFLEHGTGNRLISDRLINLQGLFFQQLFLPFWNREALAFALQFGEELLSTVPVARLAFVNDARVIEFLRSQSAKCVVMSDK